MFAKTGTEAIAESFYRVMEKQEMDGSQSDEVLAMRTKADWSFPSVLQSENAIKKIAKLYKEGDKKTGLKKHMLSVYRDKRSILKKDELSKVLKRHNKKKPRFSFLL